MSCVGSFEAICRKIVCPTRHTEFNEHDMSINIITQSLVGLEKILPPMNYSMYAIKTVLCSQPSPSSLTHKIYQRYSTYMETVDIKCRLSSYPTPK